MAVRVGRRALGGVAQAAGIAVVAVFALLAAWVVVDFNGFFAAFHSLFFANGTWTFSYDSLLITMYPPEFWIGMGAVWLAVHRIHRRRRLAAPQTGVGRPSHLRNRAEPTRI